MRSLGVEEELLVEHVTPALRANGDLDLAEHSWRALRARGTGAEAQRRVWRESDDLSAVVREAVARTA